MIGKVTRGLGGSGTRTRLGSREAAWKLAGRTGRGSPHAGKGCGPGALHGGVPGGWADWVGVGTSRGRRGARPECVAAGCRVFHHPNCHEASFRGGIRRE